MRASRTACKVSLRCPRVAEYSSTPGFLGGLARTSYRVAGSELQWQDHDGFGAIEGRGDILLRRICRARRARSCSPVRQAAVSAGRRGSAAQKVQRRGVRQRRRCAKPLPVGLVAVSRYEEGARWRPRSLSPGRALLALLANTVPARSAPERSLRTLREIIASTQVFTGRRGEADETVDLLLRTVV